MTPRPRIGITLDSEASGGYSNQPWYALRQNYCASVTAAGGIPLPLPHALECVEDYLRMVDALIVTGGAFDLDPGLYGAADRHETVTTKDSRTAFEWEISKQALAKDLPVLGICGGQQLLNVVLGGTLIQHIPDEIENALAHEQPNPRTEPGHSVEIEKGSKLHELIGLTRIDVNSAHHQAAKGIGFGVVVSGRAPDGVIEAIEAPAYRFCIGVQWHPEYAVSESDPKLMKAFIDAARGSSQT